MFVKLTAGRDVSDIGYPSSSYTLSNPDKPDLAYRSTETASSLIPDKGVPVTKENGNHCYGSFAIIEVMASVVKFTNLLQANFVPISFYQKFTTQTVSE